MAYARRLVLRAPPPDSPALARFVEDCLRDGVALVCVVGDGCGIVEDVIDELVVGDGSDPSRFLVTTSHPGRPPEEVRAFAAGYRLGAEAGPPAVEEVALPP